MPIGKCEILQQHRIAFFDAYNEVCKEHYSKANIYPKKWFVHKTINTSAPRTFIAYKNAQQIVSQMEQGIYKASKRELIEKRNQNLFNTYNQLKQEAIDRGEEPIKTILVENAIYLPTPCFYIDSRTASQIIYQMQNSGE